MKNKHFLCNCCKCNFHSLSTRMKSGAPLFLTPNESETSAPDPAIPLPGISPRKMKTHTEPCTQTCKAALLTTLRKWAQPRCPSMSDGQTARVSMTGRHPARKKNEALVHATGGHYRFPQVKPARPARSWSEATGWRTGHGVLPWGLSGENTLDSDSGAVHSVNGLKPASTSALRWSVSWNGKLFPVPTLTSQSCNLC